MLNKYTNLSGTLLLYLKTIFISSLYLFWGVNSSLRCFLCKDKRCLNSWPIVCWKTLKRKCPTMKEIENKTSEKKEFWFLTWLQLFLGLYSIHSWRQYVAIKKDVGGSQELQILGQTGQPISMMLWSGTASQPSSRWVLPRRLRKRMWLQSSRSTSILHTQHLLLQHSVFVFFSHIKNYRSVYSDFLFLFFLYLLPFNIPKAHLLSQLVPHCPPQHVQS